MANTLTPYEAQAVAAYKWAKDGHSHSFTTVTPRSFNRVVEAYCNAKNLTAADWKTDNYGRSLTSIITSLEKHGVNFKNGTLSFESADTKAPKKTASAVSPTLQKTPSTSKPPVTSPTIQRASTTVLHSAPKPTNAVASAYKPQVKVASPPKVQAAPAPSSTTNAQRLLQQQIQQLQRDQEQQRQRDAQQQRQQQELQRQRERQQQEVLRLNAQLIQQQTRDKAEKRRADKARRREETLRRHQMQQYHPYEEDGHFFMNAMQPYHAAAPRAADPPAPVNIPSPPTAKPTIDTRNMAECPVCHGSFPMAQIDSHLDSCLTERAITDMEEQDRASEKKREQDELELAIRESERLDKLEASNNASITSDSLNRSSSSAADLEVNAKKRPAPSSPDALLNDTLTRKQSNGASIGPPSKRFSPAPPPPPSSASAPSASSSTAPASKPAEDDIIFIGVQPGKYFSEQADSDESDEEARGIWNQMVAEHRNERLQHLQHAFGVPTRGTNQTLPTTNKSAPTAPVAPAAPPPKPATPKAAPAPPRPPVNLPNSGGLFSERYFTCDQDDKECPICFEEFKKDSVGIMLPCLCLYHHHCIRDWLERKPRNCPSHGDF